MYNKIVEALKVIARDSLRMNLVVGLQSKAAAYTSQINAELKMVESFKKGIARAEFQITQLVDGDPDKDEKSAKFTAQVESLNLEILEVEKTITLLNKAKDDVAAEIVKVQSGETKVSLNEVNDLTEKLIAEVTKDVAVAKARELSNV